MTKVSTCIDCATTIIGDDLLRCGACNAHRDALRAPSVLTRWIVTIEGIIILALGLILAARGCAS